MFTTPPINFSSTPVARASTVPLRPLGVTMRLLRQEKTGDMLDALSGDWGRFLETVGLRWLPLPNRGPETLDMARDLDLGGFIFSGGGDAGAEPLRDKTERLLLGWALEQHLPVLGVCRGFQAIQLYLKGQLVPLAGHVSTVHALWDGQNAKARTLRRVNSFHNLGIATLASPLIPLAYSGDPSGEGHVEAAWAPGFMGIMWHPERALLPAKRDVDLIRKFFTFPAERPLV